MERTILGVILIPPCKVLTSDNLVQFKIIDVYFKWIMNNYGTGGYLWCFISFISYSTHPFPTTLKIENKRGKHVMVCNRTGYYFYTVLILYDWS